MLPILDLSHVTNNLIRISDRTIGSGVIILILQPKSHFLSWIAAKNTSDKLGYRGGTLVSTKIHRPEIF